MTIPLDDEIELTENGMLSVPEHENWSYPLPVTEKKKKRSSRSRSANRKKKNNKAKGEAISDIKSECRCLDTTVGKAPVSETENTKIAHSDKKSGELLAGPKTEMTVGFRHSRNHHGTGRGDRAADASEGRS